jgi:hypothetical protein
MFERFGDDARRVVVVAQEEAREAMALGDSVIGAEHVRALISSRATWS